MRVLRKRLLNTLELDEQHADNYDVEKQADIAGWLTMGTCWEVSRDDATHMGVNKLKSGWVLRESGGKKKSLYSNAEHHVNSIVF